MRVRSRQVSRLLRAAGAGALTGALALAVMAAPAARAATKAPVTGGYYWADEPAPLPPPVGQPAGNIANPSVPPGDWSVAARNGGSNMETYVHIDLSAFPPAGTANSFVLHLKEDTASTGEVGAASGAGIDAVVIHEYWGDGAVSRPYGEQPEVPADATKVHGARSTTGDWTWDVTSFVTECLAKGETACGLGLLPSAGTFQVNLIGSEHTADPTGTLYRPYAEGDVAAPTSSGGTTGTTTDTVGSTTTTTPVTTPTTTAPSVVPTTPATAAPVPLDMPVPPPAAPKVVTPTPRRTAVTGGKPDHAVPFVFFLAALGIVALLGASAVTLGEAGEPVPVRTGRVFSTLDRRLAASDESKESL